MLSIVDREPGERVVSIDEARASEPVPNEAAQDEGEFEIVLGRRQMASLSFVAIVMMVAFAAIAYLAGKTAAPKSVAAAEQAPAPAITLAAPAEVITAPAALPVKPASEPIAKTTSGSERPLFADPRSGAVYLQLGAVERGVAIIMAEGLRKRELAAFVAPGPNDHIFRVLIGPLDGESYRVAKDAVDGLGLSTFARKYQQ